MHDNESINMNDEKVQKEEEIINVVEELSGSLARSELLTVQVFRSYISKEQKNPKQKIWFDFIEHFYPSKYEEISLESIMNKMDTVPHVKDKLLKARKDRESIKTFFDSFK